MLMMNGSFSRIGPTTQTGFGPAVMSMDMTAQEMWVTRYASDMSKFGAIPWGGGQTTTGAFNQILLAKTVGGVGSRNLVQIASSAAGTAVRGRNGTGQSSITSSATGTLARIVAVTGQSSITVSPSGTLFIARNAVGQSSIAVTSAANLGAKGFLTGQSSITTSGAWTGRTAIGYIAGDMVPPAIASAQAVAAQIMDAEPIEASLSLRQALRIIAAATAGKASGAETTTITFRNVGDSKNRIVATLDGNGNRTAVTLDVS